VIQCLVPLEVDTSKFDDHPEVRKTKTGTGSVVKKMKKMEKSTPEVPDERVTKSGRVIRKLIKF